MAFASADGAVEAAAPGDPGPAPAHIGRYTVIRKIGAGGMGDVYAAFDEQLDRKVAVKVLRRDQARGGEWNARLLREAQAMARLSHPNVITVHEVGEYGDRMFIAMEFVSGRTLDAWLREAPRSWQAIVATFVAAGRGLHAAHEAGIIHRDFKPSNAIVGDDGRVRVLDFGIAAPRHAEDRGYLDSSPDASQTSMNSVSAFSWKLTLDGMMLGTPTYMSPEQLAGAALTPASDQFNFCVALYEALYGAHPFIDEPFTMAELRARVMLGELREPPQRARGAPGWVFAALRRGLKARTVDRFAAMGDLLAALDGDPRRLGRRLLASAGLAVLAGLAGFAVSAAVLREPNACDGGAAAMAALWSPQRREPIAAAFRATGLTFGDTVLASVTRELDGYAGEWAAMHADACVAHRDGAQSGALLDTRMACLERRRQALDGALTLLATPDAAVVDGAMSLVGQLPRVAHCGDLPALAAAVPPPDDPKVAGEVEQLRRRLDAASSLAAVGREPESAAIAREVVARSRELGFRPLEAEGLLALGRTLLDAYADRTEVLRVLDEALLIAVGTDMAAEAAEALARRAYIIGLEAGRIEEALFDASLARALLGRLSNPGPLLGLLDNNIGAVHVAAGDRGRALGHFEEALAALTALPGEHTVELSNTLANVAMQLDAGERRDGLLARMVELRRDKLGDGHPLTAHGVILWGLYTLDPRVAVQRFERACAALDELPGDRLADRRQCRVFLGHARAEAGERQNAAAELHRALALAVPGGEASPDERMAMAATRGHAALLAGESAAAIPGLREALASAPDEPEASWWRKLDLAELRLALALNLEATGASAEVVELLDRVVPVLEAIAAQHLDVPLRQRLAAARMGRARALARNAAAPARAREEARRSAGLAEAWYRDAGAGYAWRLAAIDQWRGEVGL